MNEILHANVFFFIASAATIVFSILVCIAMYHVIKILKIIRSIMERISAGSEIIAEDMAHIRGLVKNGGMLSRVLGFIMKSPFAEAGRRRAKEVEDA